MTETGDPLVTEGASNSWRSLPMANKQIHQLPGRERAGTRRPAGRLPGRQQPHAARQPRQPAVPTRVPGTMRRTIAGKLGELVSVKDFGAVGDGPPTTALRSRRRSTSTSAIHVPAGRLSAGQRDPGQAAPPLLGAGRDVTVIDARGPRAFTFNRNAGTMPSMPAAPDWNRSGWAR